MNRHQRVGLLFYIFAMTMLILMNVSPEKSTTLSVVGFFVLFGIGWILTLLD